MINKDKEMMEKETKGRLYTENKTKIRLKTTGQHNNPTNNRQLRSGVVIKYKHKLGSAK